MKRSSSITIPNTRLVGFDLANHFGGHLLEFIEELLSRIVAPLNGTEFLLPTASEFGRLEQRRNDSMYEVTFNWKFSSRSLCTACPV